MVKNEIFEKELVLEVEVGLLREDGKGETF